MRFLKRRNNDYLTEFTSLASFMHVAGDEDKWKSVGMMSKKGRASDRFGERLTQHNDNSVMHALEYLNFKLSLVSLRHLFNSDVQRRIVRSWYYFTDYYY